MNEKSLKSFLFFLKEQKELPSQAAHLKMSPLLNGIPFRKFVPTKDAKQSAVMILLNEDEMSNINVLLTLRSGLLKNHGGQISFPGGRIEVGETPLQAAIRESKEEIGLDENSISVVRELSSIFVPPSNSLIYTFLATTDKNEFVVNKDEVEEAFFANLDYLADETNIIKEPRRIENNEITVLCWDLNKSEKLWGATAMILSELLELYKIFKNK